MEKKNLLVNCANCDMRGMKQELLDKYEKITINAAGIFTSPQVQVMTASYNIEINCANVTVLEEDVDIIRHNGSYRIKAGDKIAGKKFFLAVNGKVEIEAGTEEIMKQCAGIAVNGTLFCPASILPILPELQINGKTESYPDGAVVLAEVFCPDPVFVLRAKVQDYYVSRKVVLADEDLDVAALVEKGAHFLTPKALINEKLLKQAILLFDDETEIEVLKEGMRYLREDVTLEEKHLRKFGTSLYIDGNVRIEDARVLECVERLFVNGTVRFKEELEPEFLEKSAVIEYKKLVVERGVWIEDKMSVIIDPKLFAKGEVHVSDIAKVTIEPEVTEEQIMEKLNLSDCGVVKCSPEQRSAVEMISEDIGKILTEDKGGAGIFGLAKELLNTKVVNTSSYSF